MASGPRPRPEPDELTRPFWEAAAHHRLRVMRCSSCQRYRHPPTPVCEGCGSGATVWEDLCGEGHIWSFIVDRRNLVRGFNEPYSVALVTPVETDEDVRLVANILHCALDQLYVGMPVKVTWEDLGEGITLPQFTPSHRAEMSSAKRGTCR
jgi:uncharacterized OB-fold protein